VLSAAAAQQGLAQDKYPSRPKEGATILRMPEVKERLAADGSEVVAGTPEEFAAPIRPRSRNGPKWRRPRGYSRNE